MSREKRIEEMVEVISKVPPIVYPFGDRIRGKHFYAIKHIAEHLYNAGYRKQSVGEWVWKTKIEPQAQNRLYCSVCDEECLAKNNYYVKSNFCHNCGAKMKGGAE